jgi:hypothetical protein
LADGQNFERLTQIKGAGNDTGFKADEEGVSIYQVTDSTGYIFFLIRALIVLDF